MALNPLKAQINTRATKRFTDREKPKEVFFNQLTRLTADNHHFGVIMFYGVGGIGKSSLLRHLWESPVTKGLKRVFIDLDAAAYSSPADILLDVHRQLPFACPVFEFAIAQYFSMHGRRLADIKRSFLRPDSILFDLQEAAADLAEIVAPLRLIKRLYDMGSNRISRLLPDVREQIEAVEQIRTAEELEARLSTYLGMEIERCLKKRPCPVIFFIDSHEAAFRRSIFASIRRKGDQWLMELVGAAEAGLWVIAGRERLRWDDFDSGWSAVVDQHILGKLSAVDADAFLLTVPVEEKDVRRAIVSSALGVPLYLDLCAQIYQRRKLTNEEISERDFRITEDRVIERFLAHLPQEQAEALRAIAIPEIFDRDLFERILTGLNIGLPHTMFDQFCEGSYAVELRAKDGIFKIHEIVRDYLFDEGDARTVRCVAEQALASVEHSLAGNDHRRALWVFAQLLAIQERYRCTLPSKDAGKVLTCGIRLIDFGHWRELDTVADRLRQAEFLDERLQAVFQYLAAYCARKLGRLEQAAALFRDAEAGGSLLGAHASLLRYHLAHVTHLLGHFAEAEHRYRALLAAKPANEIERQCCLLTQRQLADVRMIQGRFREALASFEALQGAVADPLWIAEVLRFRGHVYRFNGRLSEAEALYRQARETAVDAKADAMLAKALTNLAETHCWTTPATGHDLALEAVEINSQVGAPLEVGKAMAANAVALALLGRLDTAVRVAGEAAELQRANGYRNGILYALQAEGVALHFMGRSEALQNVIERMDRLASEVTVYRFLSLPLKYAAGTPNVEHLYDPYEWLDREAVVRNHRAMMSGGGVAARR